MTLFKCPYKSKQSFIVVTDPKSTIIKEVDIKAAEAEVAMEATINREATTTTKGTTGHAEAEASTKEKQ